MEPVVAIMRRFAVDFFTAHNVGVCAEIMTPDYRLDVGRMVIRGRDDQYLPAVEKQLAQFPGLTMTVHALVVTADRAALHFSEHGASGGPGGPIASWSGIALYHFDGSQLTRCIANEDYAARRRQLKGGVPDPVAPSAQAPWDATVGARNVAAEEVVRTWLAQGDSVSDRRVCYDDQAIVGDGALNFSVHRAEILDLFSSDNHVAYAVVHHGSYLPDQATTAIDDVALFSTGIVTVSGGNIIGGHSIRDRQGLPRVA